jgi:hypothetical protein
VNVNNARRKGAVNLNVVLFVCGCYLGDASGRVFRKSDTGWLNAIRKAIKECHSPSGEHSRNQRDDQDLSSSNSIHGSLPEN